MEGINLRHFVDWACWIKANQDKIVWTDFYAQCKKFRLDGFVDVLNTIAVKHLGVELHDKMILLTAHMLNVLLKVLCMTILLFIIVVKGNGMSVCM